jgi:hypothetical protein
MKMGTVSKNISNTFQDENNVAGADGLWPQLIFTKIDLKRGSRDNRMSTLRL